MEVKYIFVLGGVTSSLGKGIIAASVAKLLRSRGLSVAIQKFDPYINVDSGTLNPYEHGECYVTEDGAECDLDLGHYERFLNTYTSKINNVSTGRIYRRVINKEREGAYLGKTVQVVPHITDEIKGMMLQMGKSGNYDVVITELGGTVGDIESLPFVEAVRQLQWQLDPERCMVIHLTYVPYLSAAKELKTKPTQHSVRVLQQNGVHPDVIVCRSEYPLPDEIREKVALFCNVKLNAVIESIDAKSIYEVPLLMRKEKLDELVLQKFNFKVEEYPSDMRRWSSFLTRLFNPRYEIDVALIGKYTELQDAYKSILESFIHAGAENECKVNVHLIQSENLTDQNIDSHLNGMSAILVAPGFGERGAEGKILSVKYAREKELPFIGISYGMQMAIVEFAQNVLKLEDAMSTEVKEDAKEPVVSLLENQKSLNSKGGTMRLGAYNCKLEKGSLAHSIYGKEVISERHRHRYEFNSKYLELFAKSGMVASGVNPETSLVEVIELKGHPFFLGVQFLPELKSTPETPHPLFVAFVKKAMEFGAKKIV